MAMTWLMLRFANLCPGQWPSEERADEAEVERAGAQREHAPQHRDDAERVVPVEESNNEKSDPSDQAKSAAGGAVDESREPRLVERLGRAHGAPPDNDIEKAASGVPTDQLLGAPAAAHALSAAVAAAFELGPDGGMLPPSQLKHDCAGSASGAFVARM